MSGIRRVTAADIPAAAAIHLHTALTAYRDIFPEEAPKPTLDDMAQTWKEIVASGLGWLAEENGQVVGVTGLVPRAEGSELQAVYVRPDRAGRGWGTRLVDRAELEAVTHDWLPLRLWVLEANARVRRWYETRGWNREPARRRTVWGSIEDVGYVFGQKGVARWRG